MLSAHQQGLCSFQRDTVTILTLYRPLLMQFKANISKECVQFGTPHTFNTAVQNWSTVFIQKGEAAFITTWQCLTCSGRGNQPAPESSFPPDAQRGGELSPWCPWTRRKECKLGKKIVDTQKKPVQHQAEVAGFCIWPAGLRRATRIQWS